MEKFGSVWMALTVCAMGIIGGCTTNQPQSKDAAIGFGDDVAFLKSHGQVVLLSDGAGKAKVAISPALEGRVMTSTAGGDDGASFGWINRQYFTDAAAGKTNPHISPYGGEDRIWLGPEGGQFSIFFAKGATFDLDHWFTPKWIDTEPFETVSTSSNEAAFRRKVSFSNYSGTPFDVQIDRKVRLLDTGEVWRQLKVPAADGVSVVGFETDNTITNTGSSDWSKQTGLLSIWILGMMNATPVTTVAIPVRAGEGPAVNDDYFGKVPAERLKTIDNVIYFKADANYRSKIGIPPARVKPMFGSYDPMHKVLTICQFTFDETARDYVNSAWKIQDNPFGGDVANSYNDGAPERANRSLASFTRSNPARRRAN